MFFDFLAESAAEGSNQASSGTFTYILFGALILFLILYMVISGKRRKKEEQNYNDMIDALTVGDSVMTIGRWFGEIVEVTEDGKFLLKTGSGDRVSYVVISREAIAQILKKEDVTTSAPNTLPPAEDPAQEPLTEEPAQEPAEEPEREDSHIPTIL